MIVGITGSVHTGYSRAGEPPGSSVDPPGKLVSNELRSARRVPIRSLRIGDPVLDVRLAVQNDLTPYPLQHELDVGERSSSVGHQDGGTRQRRVQYRRDRRGRADVRAFRAAGGVSVELCFGTRCCSVGQPRGKRLGN